MDFLSAAIGAIFGAGLFYFERGMVGAIVGGFIGLLLGRIFLLNGRIAALEKRLGIRATEPQLPRKAAVPGKAGEPALPELVIEEEKVAPATVSPLRAAAMKTAEAVPRMNAAPASGSLCPEPTAKGLSQPIEWFDIIRSYLTGGNVVVRVGVIVLFFGVAFLLKYSIERNIIPIELRLAAICLGGMAMLVIGWRLRLRMAVYSLILQGGGVGVLYLTIFSGLKLYSLVPVGVALSLLIGLAVFSALLAILQDARALAVIGIVGGFLAPVLTSTGGGSHVVLFSYYALLNCGILFTAWHKSWRELNLIGFVFTFAISALWGWRSFGPEMFATTEPFLIVFFLFYLVIGLLFARNQPLAHKGYIDCTMVFGTPVVCFTLQAYLVRSFEYGMAWSALAMGLLYAGLAWGVLKRGSAAMRTLVESFLSMGVVFGTIAIPLALDGRWTSAAWALEGAAVVWIGIRQKRPVARVFGIVLQFLSGYAFLSALHMPRGNLAVINPFCLGSIVMAMAGVFSSFFLLREEKAENDASATLLMLGWALLWWFGGGLHEIDTFVGYVYRPAVLMIFTSVSFLVFHLVAQRLSWPHLRLVYRALLFVMYGCAAYASFSFYGPPSAHLGGLFWPLAFAVHYFLLFCDREESGDYFSLAHPALLLLMIGLFSFEAYWWVDHLVGGGAIWSLVTLAIVPGLFVFFLSRFGFVLPWPVADNRRAYLYHGLTLVVLYLWLGSILVNLFCPGSPRPLRYLPFINPLDITQVLVIIVILYWFRTLACLKIHPFAMTRRRLVVVTGATVFFWLNAVLIRTLHFYISVPFRLHSMMASSFVQASLSIFWTLSAFAVMRWASRRASRVVWFVGAGLIGVVIAKLFVFDLGNTGTIARIISFLGVGVICLVIGYFAPLPSGAGGEAGEDS